MPGNEPQINDIESAAFAVKGTDLASAISPDPADQFPDVFATARLVAFMEITCARQLKPYLAKGQLSVGVRVDVSHSAPTPPGGLVKVDAKFVGKEGKLFVFEIVAHDSAGEIGRARHTRAIVDAERLEGAARKRRTVDESL